MTQLSGSLLDGGHTCYGPFVRKSIQAMINCLCHNVQKHPEFDRVLKSLYERRWPMAEIADSGQLPAENWHPSDHVSPYPSLSKTNI